MYLQGVHVQVEHSVLGTAKGSGLQVNNVVIAHGMLLAPLLYVSCKGGKGNVNITQQYNTLMEELFSVQCFVNHDNVSNSNIKFKVLKPPTKLYSSKTAHKKKDIKLCENSEDFVLEDASFYFLYKYNKMAKITEEISHWINCCSYNESYEHDIGCLVMPEFIVLMLDNPSQKLFTRTLYELYYSLKNTSIYPGLPVIVESTPFGNFSFINSWSHGIISKLLGTEQDGVLTDARLVYGCEGAPIYISENGKKGALIGLVTKTIASYNGELVGFSLGLSIKAFLKGILGIESVEGYIPLNKFQAELCPSRVNIEKLCASIVFVRCQHKWGSGVVINAAKGLIISCSHIVNHAHDSVYILCAGGHFPASVIYASPPSAAYDLALLSIGKVPGLKQLDFAERPPVIGEQVITAGYPLSLESSVAVNMTPTLSAGCVAKISSRDGPLQTTCCTQSGVSGGALIRPPDQLLGIVVANLCLTDTVLPTFSFAVSVKDIKGPVSQYLQSLDPTCLQSLTVESLAVKMEWALVDCKL